PAPEVNTVLEVSSAISAPLLTHATMTLFLVDPGVDRAALPLAEIVEVLAKTVETELGDRTWVLRVVRDEGTPPSSPPREIQIPTQTPDVAAHVHARLLDFGREWGFAFDHVLIEASAIDPSGSLNGDLWRAMEGL